MKITLPNNGIGIAIMLMVLVLAWTIPFVITLWLSLMIAPWWVATPVALAAALLALLLTVDTRRLTPRPDSRPPKIS